MPLETPVLKVSRPVAACSRCRNAKIKCDGKLPACSSCEKNGRAAECTSTNDQFARGKERSYVSTLETRIDKLQARLEEARARKPSVISIPDDETAVPSRRQSYDVQDESTPPAPTKSQRRKETSAIDDLVSDFGYLSVNATARDFYGFTSAMSYARLILSACTKDELPQGTTKALPARYTATQLIQHYLNNMFVLLPVFDEASFYASVDNVYSRHADQADALDYWMVHMVLAIANVSMSEQRGDHQYLEGIGHVCAAIGYAEDVLHPGAISSVQALVLLTEYAMLDPHHLDSWSLIGAASRAMVDLGLHQDPPKGSTMAKSKLELRRRVFHCVYALDRSTSLVQTRAFSFSDDSAKVKIPFTKAPPPQQTPLNQAGPQKSWLQSYEHALELINLRQLQSIWYTELFQSGREAWKEPYTYIWQTCDVMRKWFEGLSPSTSQNMRAFFEVDLLYSYVYVLSPSPRVPVIDPFASKLIFEHCIRYADLMLRLISDPSYTAPMTFYDAMRVYMTGRQFLDVLQHNTENLLNGFMPNHPSVRVTASPPPPMPVIPLPPGDTVLHFNTARSYHCIKQVTDCLTRFGMRWGYMSWSQRYQTETAGMLEELSQRLREMDEMAGRRRPSMWQHSSSAGSVHSSNGSIHFSSPQSLPPGSAGYQQRQQSVTMFNMPRYSDQGQLPQSTPPQHQYLAQPFSQQQQPVQSFQQQAQPPVFQNHPQFNFQDAPAVERHPNFHVPPSHQFAGWGGYGGPSAPDTLDEENARRHAEQLKIAPWIGTAPRATSPIQPSPPGSTWSNPVEVDDETAKPSKDSDQQSTSSTSQSGKSSKRSRKKSLFDALIPSRLSKRRKKERKHKPPTSVPHLAPKPRSIAGPSTGLIGHRPELRQSSDSRALHQQPMSLGSLGMLPDPGLLENVAPDQQLHRASSAYDFSIPPTSVLPPLEGRGPAPPLPPAPDEMQQRRASSMQDFAIDLLSDLIAPGTTWHHAPAMHPSPESPRTPNRTPRQVARGGGKGKQAMQPDQNSTAVAGPSTAVAPLQLAVDPNPPHRSSAFQPAPAPAYYPYTYLLRRPPGPGPVPLAPLPPPQLHHPQPYIPVLGTYDIPGFYALPGFGWACFVCNTVVQQPGLHSTDGVFCMNAQWDPFNHQQSVPQGVDVEMARRQRMAGGIVARDFAAPPLQTGMLDWGLPRGREGGSGTG